MMNSITQDLTLLGALHRIVDHEESDEDAIDKFTERFRKMIARSGKLMGIPCHIEESQGGVFFLRGFPPGRWELTCSWEEIVGEPDEQPVPRITVLQLEPEMETSLTSVSKLRIYKMHTKSLADCFFRSHWSVRRISDFESESGPEARAQTNTAHDMVIPRGGLSCATGVTSAGG